MKHLPSFRALRSALCASASVSYSLPAAVALALSFGALFIPAGATAQSVFYESFDQCNGTGGNDGSWSGSIASSTLAAVNAGWTFENGYGAKQCAKFGTGSKQGTATTPALGTAGTLALTFKAAAWNGGSEKTTIDLTVAAGGGTLNPTTITLVKGQWSDYSAVISNATAETKVKFSAKDSSNNRFFLDEVRVTQGGGDDPDPPQPTAPTISVSTNSLSVSVGGTAQASITTNSAVTSVTVSHGSLSGSSWSWTPTATGTTTVTFTATGANNATATATITVTVTAAPSGLSAPTIADASNLLSNGTGFTANWSAVSAASGYEIQVATNALFDAVQNVLLEEHFDTLTTSALPDGWTGTKGNVYVQANLAGDAAPSLKFSATNNKATTPEFSGASSVSFCAIPNGTSSSSIKVTEMYANGDDASHTIVLDTVKKTYVQSVSSSAIQLTFTFTKNGANYGFDDVFIYGPQINTVVVSPSVSGASTTSKAITGLSPNTLYYIRVRAVNGGQKSDWSNTATATTAAGQNNFAPEITSFSPTTATVAVGSTQVFSIGYSDVNTGDTLTLAVTDNGNQLTNATLSGVSGSFSYTYTAANPGSHTLEFILSDGRASVSTNATVTVPVPVPMLSAIDETALLPDGTGFTVAWSAVSVATGYELQIARRSGFNIISTEDFDTLGETTDVNGWNTTSAPSKLIITVTGLTQPSYKFANDGQTLTSPVFSETFQRLEFLTYGYASNGNTSQSTLHVVGILNGSDVETNSVAVPLSTVATNTVTFSQPVDRVRFVFAKTQNIYLDDVTFYGPGTDTIVQTLTPAAGTTTTNVVDLIPNTTYSVRIRALYNAEASAWSDYVSATTPTGGANFPPELSVTPATTNVMGGASASFTVTYSDPNPNDSLSLAVAIDGAAATPLDLASGASYTYTPAVAGAHRLIFSVSDGTYTAYSTNDVAVALAAPAIGDVTNPTSAPYGFTAHWSAVSFAEGYEVEVATDPLFDAALGDTVFTEDFYTLSDTEPPTAWTASAVNGLRYTSPGKCGARMPAFRFGTSGDTLESPEFSPGSYLEFFAFSSKGTQTLYAIGNTAGGEESITFTIAEGRGTYSTNFSAPVTSICFEFSQKTEGGYVGLDDILVRSSATKDSRIKTIAAPGGSTTSLALTSLEGAITYYVRVRATSGAVASDWSESAVVPYLAAPENVAFHHGKYIESGASLTWDPAIGADSYRIKILEADIVTPIEILSEDFYQGATAPTGWKFSGTIETSGEGYCGESAPALKLRSNASVTTPTLEYPAKSVSLIASATGDTGGSLSVSALVDGDWQVVGTLSPPNKSPTPFSFQLPEGTTKVKVAFDNYVSGTNFAIDDLVVWGTGPVWHDYNTFTTTLTTLPLPNLHHDSPYEFIVSAVNEFGEIAAELVKDTAPPNNPGTILKFQ